MAELVRDRLRDDPGSTRLLLYVDQWEELYTLATPREPNIGVRALVSRCYEIVGMAKECRDMRQLREKVARHYGRRMVQFTLSLAMPGEPKA